MVDLDWQLSFLESCCVGVDGVALGEGAFRPGPAIWVGRREVAHFDADRTLDVRVTKAFVRSRRPELVADERVALRRGASDWIEIRLDDGDEAWARGVIAEAIDANLSSAPAGAPPRGAELDRRRRFH